MKSPWKWKRCVGLLTLASVALAPLAALADEQVTRRVVVRRVAEDAEANAYWIGIMGGPLDDVLKHQLNIESGWVVHQVVQDSPAAHAGIKPHDILLKLGDTPVASLEQLADVIGQSQGKSLEVKILRQGKEQTLRVTPDRRPERARELYGPPAADVEQLKKWVEDLRRGNGRRREMLFLRPGVVIPERLRLPGWVELPKNCEVTITREEEGPAKIVVRRGEKTWEATEDNLEGLPDDIRPAIKSMLGGAYGLLKLPQARDEVLQLPDLLRRRVIVPQPVEAADLQKKLNEVLKQMRALREDVNSLKKQIGEQ